MGLDYTEALLYLLPASAVLSWSQVKDHRHEKLNGGYRKLFFLICLPLLVTGMVMATKIELKFEIKIFILVMLIIAFMIRTNSLFRQKLQEVMKKNLSLALAIMGLLHGLSNMGGSILTPLASSLYKDKKKVLAAVSFDYAFMASFQLIVLFIMKGELLKTKYMLGAVISLLVRHLIGKRVFAFTSEASYQKLLNGFILASVLILVVNLF